MRIVRPGDDRCDDSSDANLHPDLTLPNPDTRQARDRLRAARLLAFDAELLAWMQQAAPPIGSGFGFGTAGPTRLAGFDEAGRGALAGPVVVGCVCFGPFPGHRSAMNGTPASPVPAGWIDTHRLAGLDDSKKLSATRRESLYGLLTGPDTPSGVAWSAGSATSVEIDAIGIVEACRLAASRAWRTLQRKLAEDAGSDWTKAGSNPDLGLVFDRNLTLPDVVTIEYPDPTTAQAGALPLVPVGNSSPESAVWCTRGDSRSFHVAAASVIAKVTRDRIMSRLSEVFPAYGWAENMGYGTPNHRRAMNVLGVTRYHRRCFRS